VVAENYWPMDILVSAYTPARFITTFMTFPVNCVSITSVRGDCPISRGSSSEYPTSTILGICRSPAMIPSCICLAPVFSNSKPNYFFTLMKSRRNVCPRSKPSNRAQHSCSNRCSYTLLLGAVRS
jgi:hypothetical protein